MLRVEKAEYEEESPDDRRYLYDDHPGSGHITDWPRWAPPWMPPCIDPWPTCVVSANGLAYFHAAVCGYHVLYAVDESGRLHYTAHSPPGNLHLHRGWVVVNADRCCRVYTQDLREVAVLSNCFGEMFITPEGLGFSTAFQTWYIPFLRDGPAVVTRH